MTRLKRLGSSVLAFSCVLGLCVGGSAMAAKDKAKKESKVIQFDPAAEPFASAITTAKEKGIAFVPAFGDNQKGSHGTYLVLKANNEANPAMLHGHSNDDWGIVISGTITHTDQGGPAGKALKPGSWWFMPGKLPHTSACESSDGYCVVYIHQAQKFDYFPVK